MHMHGWPRFQPVPQVDYRSCDLSVGASGPALVVFVLFVVSSTSVQGRERLLILILYSCSEPAARL